MKSVFWRVAERGAAAFGSARALISGASAQSRTDVDERRDSKRAAERIAADRLKARRYLESSNRS
jgi:hypothetical protein